MRRITHNTWQFIRTGLILLLASTFGANTMSAKACVAIEVSNTSLDFGVYNPLTVTPMSESFSVTLSCITDPMIPSLVTPFSIGIDASSGNPATRLLQSGGDQLIYQIQSVDNGLAAWGPSNSSAVVSGIFPSVVDPPDQTFHGVGSIDARQNVSIGTYSDNLLIVIEF